MSDYIKYYLKTNDYYIDLTKHIYYLILISLVLLLNASFINLYSQVDSSRIELRLKSANLDGLNNRIRLSEKKHPLIISDFNKTPTDPDGIKENNHSLNPIKFSSLTIVTLGAVIGLHNMQKHAWWSGERGQFHIQNDWAYAMSMDKIGHFMEGGLIEKTMKGAFIWSGMEDRTAMWFGALFSIGYMTDIEIEDGFAKAWGYSPGG